MADVTIFISYSRIDSALADQIKTDMQSVGAQVWIDHESIPLATPDWQEAIRRGIEAATAVVYLGSPEARLSTYVRSEIALAREASRLIVPLFARGSNWLDSAPFEVTTTNYLDVRGGAYPQVREFLFRAVGIIRDTAAEPASATMPAAPQADPGSSGEWRVKRSGSIPTGSPVNAVAWTTGRGLIATANDDKTVRIFDVASGHLVSAMQRHTRPVRAVAFAPLGDRLASASDDQSVRIWDTTTFRSAATIHGHSENPLSGLTGGGAAVWSLDWSPDGARLATAGEDRSVRIWDTRSGNRLAVLKGHQQPCRCVAWSPDGRRVATASDDFTVRLWDAKSGEALTTIPAHAAAVRSVAWSMDGKRLVTASMDGTAQVWSVSSGQRLAALVGHSGPVLSAAWSSDDTQIATGGADEAVRLWDADSGRRLLTLNDHVNHVTSVQWERGRGRLASGSLDQTVRIWEVSYR